MARANPNVIAPPMVAIPVGSFGEGYGFHGYFFRARLLAVVSDLRLRVC